MTVPVAGALILTVSLGLFIYAEDAELLLGGGEVPDFGVVLAVLGATWSWLSRMAPTVEQEFVAVERDLGEVLVVDGLEVGVEGGGDVGALDFHDELALVHDVAEADVQSYYAAVGEREDQDLAGRYRG